MKSYYPFEDTRPYNDDEIPAAVDEFSPPVPHLVFNTFFQMKILKVLKLIFPK